MALTDTRGEIRFNNVKLTLGNSELLDDVSNQMTRLRVSNDRRSVMKTDFMMLAEGDIWVSQDALVKKDFLIVSGLMNYAQAITHRLMTPRGYHPADAFFGVPWYDYLGQSYTSKAVVEGQIMADLAEELSKDIRTRSIPSISAVFTEPTVISVTCEVIPVMTQEALGVSFLVGGR